MTSLKPLAKWDGRRLLQENAKAVGARSGPVALAVFSCTGRGKEVFKSDSSNEAEMADAALGGELPFVGAYVNGEIGPKIRNHYVGWALAGQASVVARRQRDQQQPGGGCVSLTAENFGRVPCYRAQGGTSMYSLVG